MKYHQNYSPKTSVDTFAMAGVRDSGTHSGPPDMQIVRPLQWRCVLCRGTDPHLCTWHTSGWGKTRERHSSPPHFHPDSRGKQILWLEKKKIHNSLIHALIFVHSHLQSTNTWREKNSFKALRTNITLIEKAELSALKMWIQQRWSIIYVRRHRKPPTAFHVEA